jgi:hypothetical protein
MSQLSKVIAKTALSYTSPLEKLERTRVPIKRKEHHTKNYIEQFDGIHGSMSALFVWKMPSDGLALLRV